jgi:predicted regulator of Ras-like GTPase activity (Roadblock/LC7/MglB family)
MATPNELYSPAKVAAIARHLEAFGSANPSVTLTVLTSGDGFEIAAHPVASPVTARVAAMTSSMQALSVALTKEAGLNRSRTVITETNGGAALILGLDDSLPRTALAVIASGSEPLGKLLWAARNLCKALEKTLSQ